MLMRVGLASVLAVCVALAQGPGRGLGPRAVFGPGGGPGGPGARFLGAEAGMGGRVVKGAPVSADIITETTQTLPDGNRIHQTNTVRFYRDSEGRTRRETSLNALGQLGVASNMPQVTFINDPVAGANYALNANDRTANRSSWTPRGPGGGRGNMQNRPPRPGPNAAGGPGFGPRGGFGRGGANNPNTKVESLGRQTIEGVAADGTRTTMTIPAGQIGNDAPIQIVHERWYSPDLQMVVLEKQSDPRRGDTITRFTNVNRSEPSRTLFEVPADYKVIESRMGPRPTVGQ